MLGNVDGVCTFRKTEGAVEGFMDCNEDGIGEAGTEGDVANGIEDVEEKTGIIEGENEGFVEGFVDGVTEGMVERLADGDLEGTAEETIDGIGVGAEEVTAVGKSKLRLLLYASSV